MKAIDLMVEEHRNIKRVLKVIRKYCVNILNGEEIDYKDFYKIIDFVRIYADKHHHGKEEVFLFNKMIDEIKGPAEKLVKHGMLVEHDLGRLFIQNLEVALKSYEAGNMDSRVDIIANSVGYADLLERHIAKEDDVVYKFAENKLSKGTLDKLDEECSDFELKAEGEKLQNKYLELINELENKVASIK
ncbi:hemerythrin domain-containing protein [Clostridium sp.]|uniref:hemerythrin domain-containing protein n=1 Tax=Clostridium sp. TaxID=1506 RepID=UPI002FC9EE11